MNMYGINNRDKNSNFPLWQNKKKNEYYYDFGTQKAIKIPPKEKTHLLRVSIPPKAK